MMRTSRLRASPGHYGKEIIFRIRVTDSPRGRPFGGTGGHRFSTGFSTDMHQYLSTSPLRIPDTSSAILQNRSCTPRSYDSTDDRTGRLLSKYRPDTPATSVERASQIEVCAPSSGVRVAIPGAADRERFVSTTPGCRQLAVIPVPPRFRARV